MSKNEVDPPNGFGGACTHKQRHTLTSIIIYWLAHTNSWGMGPVLYWLSDISDKNWPRGGDLWKFSNCLAAGGCCRSPNALLWYKIVHSLILSFLMQNVQSMRPIGYFTVILPATLWMIFLICYNVLFDIGFLVWGERSLALTSTHAWKG